MYTQSNLVGMGLCSSLGGVLDAFAAERAGLNRFTGHHEMKTMMPGDDAPEVLTVSPSATNLWMYQGIARSIKLLQSAYQDLMLSVGADPALHNPNLFFAMPDPEDRGLETGALPGTDRQARLGDYTSNFTERLFSDLNPALEHLPSQYVFGDRAAFARVMEKGIKSLSDGNSDHCLIFIVDSLLDDEFLDLQFSEGLLKSGKNPVGYVPGEGAAVIWMSRAPVSINPAPQASIPVQLSLAINIVHTNGGRGDENESAQWHGERLSQLIVQQLGKIEPGATFPVLYLDINGTEERAVEAGNVRVKLAAAYPDTHFPEAGIPALCFGECGTLMGPLAFGMILHSLRRAYAVHTKFIICLSESEGRRAVLSITTPNQGGLKANV